MKKPITENWHRHTYNGGQTIEIIYSNDLEDPTFNINVSCDGYCGLSSSLLCINAIKLKEFKELYNKIGSMIKKHEAEESVSNAIKSSKSYLDGYPKTFPGYAGEPTDINFGGSDY